MGNELFDLADIFLRSIMVGVAASITVGPVAVLCIQRTLSKSRQSGLVSGLGVASADTLMALIAYFFYSVLQGPIDKYNVILRIIGGVFVVGVGAYIFLQNPVMQIRKNRAGKSSPWQDFGSIFGLTIANFLMVIPYILAFFAVFKISTGDAVDASSWMSGLIIIAGFFSGAVAWWTALAFVINLFRTKFRPRHMLTINHVAGSIIGLLGVYTILSTFLNLIPNGTI
ncbi:MAG: LysE family transporter [Rikenellaceae bacterium]